MRPVAQQVKDLLDQNGLRCETEKRGFDHGAFVPLMLGFPEADVPVVSLSLKSSMDPEEHIQLGRALAPLREQGHDCSRTPPRCQSLMECSRCVSAGVLLVGSGMSFHNMRAFRGPSTGKPQGATFDKALTDVMGLQGPERNAHLAAWTALPEARYSHPREEHLLPLLVIAGSLSSAGHI
jgi:aromatic ring-opening dioxygenase catalytic subunit (LigB family)